MFIRRAQLSGVFHTQLNISSTENPHSNVANCATLEWGTLGFLAAFRLSRSWSTLEGAPFKLRLSGDFDLMFIRRAQLSGGFHTQLNISSTENPHSNVANCATLEWGTLGFLAAFRLSRSWSTLEGAPFKLRLSGDFDLMFIRRTQHSGVSHTQLNISSTENPHSNVANCATLEWGTLGFLAAFRLSRSWSTLEGAPFKLRLSGAFDFDVHSSQTCTDLRT